MRGKKKVKGKTPKQMTDILNDFVGGHCVLH